MKLVKVIDVAVLKVIWTFWYNVNFVFDDSSHKTLIKY